MKKGIFALVLTMAAIAYAGNLSYSVSIEYDSGSLSLKKTSLAEASAPPSIEGKEYMARMMSFKGETLFETTFSINTLRFNSPPPVNLTMIEQPEELKKVSLELLLPYYPNARSIVITKDGRTLLEIDLTTHATCNENNACDGSESPEACGDCTCGNGICEENYLTCSQDCPSGLQDNVCDRALDRICDPDCSAEEDADCRQPPNNTAIYIAIPLLLAAAAGAYFMKGKKKR